MSESIDTLANIVSIDIIITWGVAILGMVITAVYLVWTAIKYRRR